MNLVHFRIWLIIPNSFSKSVGTAQDVWKRCAAGMEDSQTRSRYRIILKMFIRLSLSESSTQLTTAAPIFSSLCFLLSSCHSCLLHRLSQTFIPTERGSSFSDLLRNLALTSFPQGVISEHSTASVWWFFVLCASSHLLYPEYPFSK